MSNPTEHNITSGEEIGFQKLIEAHDKWFDTTDITSNRGSVGGIKRPVYPGRLNMLGAAVTTHHDFQPLNDRLLLRDVSTTKTHSADGIEIPETFRQKSHEAIVIAMGRLALKEGDVCIGDIVKYSEFGHEPIEIDGEELLLVRYMDLKGVRARA